MQWVRALSQRKRESTAEVSLRRVAPLGGNSFPHIPNQRENRKMCRDKTKNIRFFLKWLSGRRVRSNTGHRMVFSLVSGSSRMAGVVGWCLR